MAGGGVCGAAADRVQQAAEAFLGIGGEVVFCVEGEAGDEELTVFRVVLVVNGVIAQFEPGTGKQRACAAFAAKGLACEVLRLLAQGGVAGDFVGVGAVVGGLRVVVFEAGRERVSGVALTGACGFVAAVGGDGLVVVAGELGLAGLELSAAAPVVDGVLGFDAVGTVVADDRVGVLRYGVVGVEEDQGVNGGVGAGVLATRLTAAPLAVVAADRGRRVGAVGVAETDPFFCEQAFDEGEIGFSVLQAVGARRVGLAQVGLVLEAVAEGGVAGQVFVEDRSDDLGNAFILENAAVASVGEGGEGRFDGEGVGGKAAVGAVLFDAGDEAGEQAFATVG